MKLGIRKQSIYNNQFYKINLFIDTPTFYKFNDTEMTNLQTAIIKN